MRASLLPRADNIRNTLVIPLERTGPDERRRGLAKKEKQKLMEYLSVRDSPFIYDRDRRPSVSVALRHRLAIPAL